MLYTKAVNYYRKNLGKGSILARLLFPFVFALAYLIGKLKGKRIQDAEVDDNERKEFFTKKPLKMPVLGLIGEHDGCFYPPLFRFLHSEKGGSSLSFQHFSDCKTIENAGHFSFVEQPETVAQHLLNLFRVQEQGLGPNSLI